MVLHGHIEHELGRVVGGQDLEGLVEGRGIGRAGVISGRPLEVVDIQKLSEHHLAIDRRALIVHAELRVHRGGPVPQSIELAREAVDMAEVVQLVGDLVRPEERGVRSGEELELRVRRAASGNRDVERTAHERVRKAVEALRPRIAGLAQGVVDGEVREALIHHGDDGRLQRLELRRSLQALRRGTDPAS